MTLWLWMSGKRNVSICIGHELANAPYNFNWKEEWTSAHIGNDKFHGVGIISSNSQTTAENCAPLKATLATGLILPKRKEILNFLSSYLSRRSNMQKSISAFQGTCWTRPMGRDACQNLPVYCIYQNLFSGREPLKWTKMLNNLK